MLQRLGANIDVATKKLFGMRKPDRHEMGVGHVVLLFVGQTRDQCDAAIEPSKGDIECSRVVHVSRHSYSPWLSTYQDMTWAVAGNALDYPPLVGAPQVNMTFRTKYFMLDQFDLCFKWHMAVYLVGGKREMVARFLPGPMHVVLTPEPDISSNVQVAWTPWEETSPRPRGAWAGVLADMEGVSDEQEDTDHSDHGADEESEDAADEEEASGSRSGPDDDDTSSSSSSSSQSSSSSVADIVDGLLRADGAAGGGDGGGEAGGGEPDEDIVDPAPAPARVPA